jgi:outer membrane protein TolC
MPDRVIGTWLDARSRRASARRTVRRAKARRLRLHAVLSAFLILISVLPAPASAQTPTIRRVEFDEAVRLALERNPTIATATVAVADADARLQQARSLTFPGVNAQVTNVTIDGIRGFGGNVTQPRSQSTFGVTASMPLLAAPSWAGVTEARGRSEVANLNTFETRRQVATEAAAAYLEVIAAKRQLEVAQIAVENARAHLDYAEKRLEGGVGSRLNQLRAAQTVSDFQTRVETVRVAILRRQEALGVVLAENGPVDAGDVPALDRPVGVSETDWMAARPDFRASAADIRVSERVVDDSWKTWLPVANVSFDPLYVTPTSLFQPSTTYRLGFQISQRIFDKGPRAETALKRVALDRSRLARTALEIQARSEVRTADAAVTILEQALTTARLAAEQANEVLRISSAAFELGATTNLEVIDAQRSARDAETAVALAEDAVLRARLDLLVALGRFPQ